MHIPNISHEKAQKTLPSPRLRNILVRVSFKMSVFALISRSVMNDLCYNVTEIGSFDTREIPTWRRSNVSTLLPKTRQIL